MENACDPVQLNCCNKFAQIIAAKNCTFLTFVKIMEKNRKKGLRKKKIAKNKIKIETKN